MLVKKDPEVLLELRALKVLGVSRGLEGPSGIPDLMVSLVFLVYQVHLDQKADRVTVAILVWREGQDFLVCEVKLVFLESLEKEDLKG